jgi:hypothetical protein
MQPIHERGLVSTCSANGHGGMKDPLRTFLPPAVPAAAAGKDAAPGIELDGKELRDARPDG